jgi:hypothetical protein
MHMCFRTYVLSSGPWTPDSIFDHLSYGLSRALFGHPIRQTIYLTYIHRSNIYPSMLY